MPRHAYTVLTMKALALTMLALGAFVVAQASGLRASIEASNKKIQTAMMKKDFATLDKIFKAGMTKDFRYVENGKTEAYDVMMQGIKMGFGQMQKITTVKTKIMTLNEKGNGGTCTSEHTMAGTMVGEDKKKHSMSFTGASVETYVKVGKDWKMSKMEWKATKMTMDGKPMPMGAGG